MTVPFIKGCALGSSIHLPYHASHSLILARFGELRSYQLFHSDEALPDLTTRWWDAMELSMRLGRGAPNTGLPAIDAKLQRSSAAMKSPRAGDAPTTRWNASTASLVVWAGQGPGRALPKTRLLRRKLPQTVHQMRTVGPNQQRQQSPLAKQSRQEKSSKAVR